MLSHSAAYALRAVVHLAAHGGRGPLQADAVARDLGTPRNYMSKVLHALTRAGVLTSVRGPHGGFALAVPAAALTLDRVVEPFAAPSQGVGCLLGADACADGRCGVRGVCAAHARWVGIAQAIRGFFVTTTVAALVAEERTSPALDEAGRMTEVAEREGQAGVAAGPASPGRGLRARGA